MGEEMLGVNISRSPVKKTRKLDFIAISKDPEYKRRFGWRMNP